ncbi:hypothetical protein MMC14_009389 [Varicellaria rhodocarpa]|nr:hypothetical protein [Varicellaria rhodocarpa]
MLTMLVLLLYFEAYSVSVAAAPISNSDSSQTTVGWVPDPYGRGTFSLVLSCVITLSICVWSAIHLNIPPPNERLLQGYLRTSKWVVLGIVAPELVVFAAWRQLISAKALQDRIQELHRHDSQSKTKLEMKETMECRIQDMPPSPISWTKVHGFYAGMGGFTFNLEALSAIGKAPCIKGYTRLTLTARGVTLLAECGLLPEVMEREITDKNKTDGIAKFLSCLQALWMLVQVIGRVASGLPVTLLEVNTLAHVLCAVFIYVLWWHKPRFIHEPTELNGEWVAPVCAYMYMSSKISGRETNHPGLIKNSWIKPELSMLVYVPQDPSSQRNYDAKKNEPRVADEVSTSVTKASTWTCSYPQKTADLLSTEISSIEARSTHSHASKVGSLEPRPPVSDARGTGSRKISLPATSEKLRTPSTMQLSRWTLATEAMHCYEAIGRRVHARQSQEAETKGNWFEPVVEELLTETAENWPSEGLLRGIGGLVMGMVLWFASMAYGGAHTAAWNDYFPSVTEAWMWRLSSVFIAACGFLWLSINWLARLSSSLNNYWDRVMAREAHWTSYLLLGTICSVCGIAYVFARIFLVVEAFISIRQLPSAAYETPNWTQLIPHL